MNWENFSDKTSHLIGQRVFFIIYTIICALSLTAGIIGLDPHFSAFTLGLSILAIYVVIFLQNSQNRTQELITKWLKEDLKHTKEINQKLDAIIKHSKTIRSK